MENLTIGFAGIHPDSIITLPLSKSESNRALIIQFLSGGKVSAGKLSKSNDVKLLQQVLESRSATMNVVESGTAMRFLLAACAFNHPDVRLEGSGRMNMRPVGELVQALRQLGADIQYPDREGFPPVIIRKSEPINDKNEVSIRGDVSSQFVSALLMIACTLPSGLTIQIQDILNSGPYVELTLDMLKSVGIHSEWKGNSISIAKQEFSPGNLQPGADWSAAAFWYSICALSPGSSFAFSGLSFESKQGDRIAADWFRELGVESKSVPGGVICRNTGRFNPRQSWDFSQCPDLAPAMIVCLAAHGITSEIAGIQSLRIKESDRVHALQTELSKFDVSLEEKRPGHFRLAGKIRHTEQVISSHGDHRIAMAFAAASTVTGTMKLDDGSVVSKSYPEFWNDLCRAGFRIQFENSYCDN